MDDFASKKGPSHLGPLGSFLGECDGHVDVMMTPTPTPNWHLESRWITRTVVSTMQSRYGAKCEALGISDVQQDFVVEVWSHRFDRASIETHPWSIWLLHAFSRPTMWCTIIAGGLARGGQAFHRSVPRYWSNQCFLGNDGRRFASHDVFPRVAELPKSQDRFGCFIGPYTVIVCPDFVVLNDPLESPWSLKCWSWATKSVRGEILRFTS